MKKIKKYISLFVVATVLCFSTATVSAAAYSANPTPFTVMFRSNGLIAGKQSGPANKKAKPDHSNNKDSSSLASTKSSAVSSQSQASSKSSSVTSSSATSSAVIVAASSKSSPSLLIPAMICLAVGIAFAAVAIAMRNKNKKDARLLDVTSEIEISDEMKQPPNKSK